MLEHSADAVVQTSTLGALDYLNPAARLLMSLAPEAPVSTLHVRQFAAAGTLRQLVHSVLPALQGRGVWLGELTLRLGGKGHVPFSVMALAHRDAAGRIQRYSAVLRDISADVQARQQIKRQNDILGAITEALPATVVIVDSQGRYRFVNSAFERQARRSADQILGRTAVEVLGAEEVARRKPFMMKAFAGEPVDFMLDYPGEQGPTWLALHCIPLKLDGVVDGFVGISQDITTHRREQERLRHLAERDPLTGLLNRAGFEQAVARERWREGDNQLALLCIDLDHFKPVNDEHGHLMGDRLLQRFAERLAATVRSSDLVTRLGGDEFAIVLTGVHDLATAEAVADKVLAAASRPFDIEGQRLRVSASIGVALMAPDDQTLEAVMLRADRLLYRAKAAGRGRKVSGAPQAGEPAHEHVFN
ncbi:diguanylate cyclase [Aquabacterium sp.]|uniref:diguanylate cyclase domain-containing protein n=1 Tax=Aquabacterium sp. TaxID=1872578 RepID=UPI0025C31F6E|nr:diguanylate cyclase [Aquabacterium sp.]